MVVWEAEVDDQSREITSLTSVLMENSEEELHAIRVYSDICTQLARIGDVEGYLRSSEKLFHHARLFHGRVKLVRKELEAPGQDVIRAS
jgi:hypothetical protein